jgi:hypothetical protein
MPDRPQKITFAEMHESAIRGLLVYCADYLTPVTRSPSAATTSEGFGVKSQIVGVT